MQLLALALRLGLLLPLSHEELERRERGAHKHPRPPLVAGYVVVVLSALQATHDDAALRTSQNQVDEASRDVQNLENKLKDLLAAKSEADAAHAAAKEAIEAASRPGGGGGFGGTAKAAETSEPTPMPEAPSEADISSVKRLLNTAKIRLQTAQRALQLVRKAQSC